jgi:hypothetical protein
MKTTIYLLFAASLVASSCQQQENNSLTITNSLEIPRQNEIVNFTFDELEELTGPFIPDKRPLFLSAEDTLTAQFIDYQGDDLPEEILIEVSLAPGETKKLKMEWLDSDLYPDFPHETSLHFAKHAAPGKDIDTALRLQTVKTEETSKVYQMEGPAWENQNVGFRNYFDLRNGMDIFGKKTHKMVLENVGLKTQKAPAEEFNFQISYHEPSDWGMDILKVGNSLGAGAVAVEFKDSLYRLGDNGSGIYEKLYEGPLKSEFRFSFPDWKASGELIPVVQYVSIKSGDYHYTSNLFLQESSSDVSFVTGIVNKGADQLIEYNAGDEHIAFLTHSEQAEDGKFLGMAVMVKKNELLEAGETTNEGAGITETYFVKINAKEGESSNYRFYAFWATENTDFEDIDNIKDILNRDALRFENPLKITR